MMTICRNARRSWRVSAARVIGSLACTAALVAVYAIEAVSSEVVLMSPRDLGTKASVVLRGTVRDVSSSWNEKGTKIFTRTTVDVAETYKGSSLASVEVVELGGIVGKVKMTVSGAVLWQKGEEVLLFLEPSKKSSYQIVGLSQGKFAIEHDPLTGKSFVTGTATQGGPVKILSSDGGASLPQPTKVELESFLAEALGRK